jgi:hypothetical protein
VESVVKGKNNEVVLNDAFTTVLLDSNAYLWFFPRNTTCRFLELKVIDNKLCLLLEQSSWQAN